MRTPTAAPQPTWRIRPRSARRYAHSTDKTMSLLKLLDEPRQAWLRLTVAFAQWLVRDYPACRRL